MNLDLGRTMLIVAHPDDESGGAGVLLQRLKEVMVVYCTDGAPDDPWFWRAFPTRQAYADVRRKESLQALSVAGVTGVSFLSQNNRDEFRDQKLYCALPAAAESIDRLIRWFAPDTILTTAYEGGHPDHDCCAFISAVAGAHHGVAVWEFPLYHRDVGGELRFQRFLQPNGNELELRPTTKEKGRKRDMLSCYRSQPDLDSFVTSERETFRPQEKYDFSKPPASVINYETWGWKMRPAELCCRFSKFTDFDHVPVSHRTVTAVAASIAQPEHHS